MADTPIFDTAAARADGVPDEQIAAFLAPKVGFDLAAAQRDGVSAADIVDYLAPAKAAPAPTPAEAPSGTVKGIAKAAGQGLAEIPGNVVKGLGAGVAAAGTGMGAVERADRDLVRDRLDIMDRIDRGEEIKPQPVRGMAAPMVDPALQFANQYAGADADERKAMRQSTMNEIARPDQTTGERIAQSTKKVGGQVFGAGQAMGEAVDKAIPLTEEEQGRGTVQFTKALTGLAGYVGAAALAGMPGVIGYAGVDAMGQTYEDAKTKGATDEDAAAAGVFSGLVQGGMMTVPVGQALKVMEKLPAAFKGEFIKTVVEMAKSGATLTAFSQVSQLADNVVAKNTYDPERKVTQGLGEHLGPTFAAGAVLPVVAVGAQRVAQRIARKVSPADAKPVMDAPDVDQAIDAANRIVETQPVVAPDEAAQLREFGGQAGERQAGLLDLFGGLNAGTVERAADNTYHYQTEQDAVPLKVWDPRTPAPEPVEGQTAAPTISPALAKAQVDHYGKLGIDVVYFENDQRIPFDGAVDPKNPNTIFLSNDPQRNAAQVGAHEVTHVLERTTLPDGTNLADIFHQQIAQGVTEVGMAHARERFMETAPKREQFGEGAEGDRAHNEAVTIHLIRELGADIGGEAPRFQTFLPKVVDQVQQRYGLDVAKDIVRKLIDGIRDTMRTLREFFARPDEHAELGQPETVSQNWVTNLGEVHDTLAKMYAERFGTQAEKENAQLAAMRDKTERDRFVEAPAPEVPPPTAPEGFFDAGAPESITPEAQRPAIEEAHQRIVRMRRWLAELDEKRRADAEASPQVAFLRQTEATILGKVRGVEDRLTKVAAERLGTVRGQLSDLLNPATDSPDMTRVREALTAEQQRLADAAAVGSARAPMGGRSGGRPRAPRQEPQRIQAVMPEARPAEPAAVEPAQAAEAEPVAPVAAETPPAAVPEITAEAVAAPPLSAVGRERQMREQAAEQIRWAVEQGGISPEMVPQITRLYHLEPGDDPSVAFHRAVAQWITLEEARAIRTIEGDAKALEEPYIEGERKTDADTLRGEPTGTPEAAGDETPAAAPERPESREAGGEPAGGGTVPAQAAEAPALKGPAFSPRQIESPEFKGWFRDSKIVDAEGKPAVMYRGDFRDTGPKFKVNKTTSARFYFTDDPRVAEGYATGKPYIDERAEDFADWFRFPPAKGTRTPQNLTRLWYSLDDAQRERVKDTLLRAHEEDDGMVFDETRTGGIASIDHWDREVRDARGNWLAAAKEVWLSSGALFGREGEFMQILDRAGVKSGEFDNPHEGRPVVTPVYLSIQNPVATNEINGALIERIAMGLKGDRSRRQEFAGNWDKVGITPREWLQGLREEYDKKGGGTVDLSDSHAWTAMPEKITESLQRMGFDGVDDRGGKAAGPAGLTGGNHRVVIAFEPTQIKSAIGNRGTFDPANADIRMSPRLTGANPDRTYTPEQQKAFENVGRATETTSLRDRVDNVREDLAKKALIQTVDAYAGVKESDPNGYVALRMANSAAGAKNVFYEYGPLAFDGKTYALKDRNGGVNAMIRSLHGEAHDFLWWVAANRAERLKAEDRENLFTQDDIDTLKKTNRGELAFDYELSNGKTTRSREVAYADALRKMDVFNKNGTDLAVESGLLKRGDVDALWSDPFYVPFYREAGEGTAFVGPRPTSQFVKQNAFKTLKGGSEKLSSDLWKNAFGNWDHLIDASIRNRAAGEVLGTAVRLGAAEKLTPQQALHLSDKEQKAQTAWVMEDGKKVYYRVNDPFVLSAVAAVNATGKQGVFMDVARWFSRALRYGVTSNPIFAVRNIIRDTENSIAVSDVSKNPFRNLADGFAQVDMKGRLENVARAIAGRELEALKLPDEAVNALAGGALMRLGSVSEGGIPKTDIRNVLDSDEKLAAFRRYFRDVAASLKEVLGAGEDINRLALYHQTVEKGGPHDFAAFSARDLQDFSLRGASDLVRLLTDVTPFLGARMQGLYKLGRAAKDSDKSIAAAVGGGVAKGVAIRAGVMLGAMTLASLALDAIYHDDEEYKARTEYDRNTYYWFRIGDARFRIPKGFELAALSSMAVDGVEAFFDKEMTGRRLVDNFWANMQQNLQLQLPAIVQPLENIASNTRGTGGPIENEHMKSLLPEDRFTGDTTLLARGVSDVANKALRAVGPSGVSGPSPVQLDYLTNAYGGWLASSVAGMADAVARSVSNQPNQPAQDFWAQATQGLVSTEPRASSRYVDMLYQQGKSIEQAYSTYRDLIQRGQGEEAQRFFEANKETLQKHGLVSGVMRLEGDLNRQIRMISNNPDSRVTAEQKRIQIMQLQALRSRAAEQAFGAR